MSEALALVETDSPKPMVLMRNATDIAHLCKEIVVKTAVVIGKKRYVPVEGWCTIANAYGTVPSIREVIVEATGIRAICDLKRQDGTVIASAEGFVGNDEPTWANRPLYARRAMAQTRSISRVCRTAFAFIVTMMDAGLSTTPLEELPKDDLPPVEPRNIDARKAIPPAAIAASRAADAVRTAEIKEILGPSMGKEPERSKATTVRYGKSKGKFLCEIDDEDLAWQLAAARKSHEANDKTWAKANEAWFMEVQKEAARRVQG